jgi:antitoxin MazE
MGTATTIAKWGNSTGVRIAKGVAEQAGLHEGDLVNIEVEGPGVLVLRAIRQEPTLKSLVSKITPKNRHGETNWGVPQGNEVW